jgi:multicomponent Na+:H+ antiporter subunit D
MIGVPPVSGFVSKWYLALGTLDLNNSILLVVLLVSSLLNAGYFVPIVLKSFFGKPLPEDEHAQGNLELSPLVMFMVVPLMLTAVASVILGFYPDFLLKIINTVVKGI